MRIFSRRGVIELAAGATVAVIVTKPAEASTLAELLALGENLDHAAKAVGTLADSIAKAVRHGAKGWSSGSAHQTRDRLKRLSVRLTGIAVSQQIAVLPRIESYISDWGVVTQNGSRPVPSARLPTLRATWAELVDDARDVLMEVEAALRVLANERSDFVLSDSYAALRTVLAARGQVLNRLVASPPPVTAAEVRGLRVVHKRYEQLHQNLARLTRELNAYIGAS